MSISEENSVVRLARHAIAHEAHRRENEQLPTVRVASSVSGIIVVGSDLTYLPRTLEAVLSQQTLPAHLLIVHAPSKQTVIHSFSIPFQLNGRQFRLDVRQEPRHSSFGAQISYELGHGRIPSSSTLLWLLHDDSRPADSTVLARLLEAYRKAPNVSVVGTKQIAWNANTLQDVGWFLDRHGRRASLVLDGEEDQSQYDNRQDVLGVSLAGALISKATWRAVGGPDAWMGTYGESTDFCRRVWKHGKRVIVLPQAATRHVRARFSGLRSEDGSHHRGKPRSTTLARLKAQEKIAITNTHLATILPAFILSIVRALGLFVRELFHKHPDRAFAILAIPWLRLAYMPRRLAPSRSYRKTGISARRYPALVTTHAQMRDWRLRRRAFKAQDGGEPLNPLARAHLHLLARRRVFDCVFLFIAGLAAMIAASWSFLPSLLTGNSLMSTILAPTAATAAQTFEAGTLMWTHAIGVGMVGAPLPFNLVLGLFALLGGGHLTVGITLLWLFTLPCAMLSMYAVAGTITRSRALRVTAALLWGSTAFLFGIVQTGALPQLVVLCFLPLSFYFVFRAVGWYAVDEPHEPHPSVQAAAVASLLMALVTLSEPQLILPLVLAFLLYLFMVKEHKAMLLLMPVPSIVALAPTFYYVLFWAREGAWRQFFADALIPETMFSSPTVLITHFVGNTPLPGWSEKILLIAAASIGVVLVVAALFSLLVRSSRRMSRMSWVLVMAGAGLLLIAPRIGIATARRAGQAAITASCVPALLVCTFGAVCAMCALTGMNDSLFRVITLDSANHEGNEDLADRSDRDDRSDAVLPRVQTISARRTPLAGLRASVCIVLLCGIAVSGVLVASAWKTTAQITTTQQALPIVAASDLSDRQSRILAVRAHSATSVDYWTMGTGSGDLIDVSPMASVWLMNHKDPNEETIAATAARLVSGGGDVADSLTHLGIIGIYVPPLSQSAQSSAARQARSALVSHILSADDTVQVTNTADEGMYVRLQETDGGCSTSQASSQSSQATSQASSQTSHACDLLRTTHKAWQAAHTDSQRIIWLILLAVVILIYLLVAIPRSRHLSSDAATQGGR